WPASLWAWPRRRCWPAPRRASRSPRPRRSRDSGSCSLPRSGSSPAPEPSVRRSRRPPGRPFLPAGPSRSACRELPAARRPTRRMPNTARGAPGPQSTASRSSLKRPPSDGIKKPDGTPALRARPSELELELEARPEEVSAACDAESVEHAVAVRELEPDVVCHVPVHHGGDAPERAALDRTVVEIAVRETTDELPRAPSAREHRVKARDAVEVTAFAVVRTSLSGDQIGREHLAAVQERIARPLRSHLVQDQP